MLELVCRVYNINKGHNKELLERCKWLSDYMTFVDKVRECHKNHGDDRLIEDIMEAIGYCINNGILREFFETRKTEVLRMTKVDYTFERRMKLNYDEGRDDRMKLGEKMELSPRGSADLCLTCPAKRYVPVACLFYSCLPHTHSIFMSLLFFTSFF